MRHIIALLTILILAAGCTSNQRAQNLGGTQTITLPPGKQLVNITWKANGSLWLLTKERPRDHAPAFYEFKEDSSWGILEGTVLIKEQ